jgi:4-aminobutyrate aminotransferase-like enzyme
VVVAIFARQGWDSSGTDRARAFFVNLFACTSHRPFFPIPFDTCRFPNEIGGGMGGVIRAFDPYKYRSLLYQPGMTDEEFSAVCLKQLEEQIIYENPESIAAMFIETVTGTNGIIPPPNGYLQGLRKLLTKYGILLVCDEVMCGVGRTGKWFACDHWGVEPDILTMAKGVTSAFQWWVDLFRSSTMPRSRYGHGRQTRPYFNIFSCIYVLSSCPGVLSAC